MNIGLLGLAFESGNKGCEALSFSFLDILNKICQQREEKYDVIIFQDCSIERIYKIGRCYNLNLKNAKLPGVSHFKEHITNYGLCNVIFDFTAGDSFSDIYGFERFFKLTLVKIYAIRSGAKFVLGSQTYGPYRLLMSKMMARYVFNHSYKIFSRDSISSQIVKSISKQNVCQTIDVAYLLDYQPCKYIDTNLSKIVVGFNPSGLLWNGGYTRNNQFGLKVDYRDYCRSIIRELMDRGIHVVLIPHVITSDMSLADNDLVAIEELRLEFPKTTLSPMFETPIEAKSFISSLSVFSGARMHANIASLSAGVPTIPFAYSDKFSGVFGDIGYKDYVIDARILTTHEAVKRSLKLILYFIDNRGALKEVHETIDSCKRHLMTSIDELLNDLSE